MVRLKELSDREMTLSPDDVRSSTEVHVTKSSRDMSVADHHTPSPVCGGENFASTDKMYADLRVEKSHDLQSTKETPFGSIRTSPRPMKSRAYTPLPFIKPYMPASDITHKIKDVVTPDRDCIVSTEVQAVGHASIKVPRIYSPVPYSRFSSSYSPVNWQKPIGSIVPEERQPVPDERQPVPYKRQPVEDERPIPDERKSVQEEKKPVQVQRHDPDASLAVPDERQPVQVNRLVPYERRSVQIERPTPDEIHSFQNERQPSPDKRQPIQEETQPFPEERQPVQDERQSSPDKRQLIQEETQSVPEERQPVPDERQPSPDKRQPVQEDTKPVQEERQYVPDERQPNDLQTFDMLMLVSKRLSEIPPSDDSSDMSENSPRIGNCAKSDNSARTDNNARTINSARSDNSARSHNSAKSDNSFRTDNSARTVSSARIDSSARSDNSARTNKSARNTQNSHATATSKTTTNIRPPDKYTENLPTAVEEKLVDNNIATGIESESINTIQERLSPQNQTQMETDIKEKERRRQELLIKMKPSEDKNQDSTVKTTTKQKKLKKSPEATKPKTSAVKKRKEPEESQEIQEFKKVYEAHLKEKEEFEKMIDRRENELNEQLREMEEVMGSIQSEHEEIEKITGAFADAVKAHTNYKEEASRVRVQHIEQEISSDILFEENEELKEKIRELYDKINEIKEKRAIGLQGLKQDTEEMKCAAELLRIKNDEVEAETKQKIQEFNSLRMSLMDKGITYVKKGTIVKGVDNIASVLRDEIPSLKSANVISTALDISEMNNVSPDIETPRNNTKYESSRLSKWISEQNVAIDRSEKKDTESDANERNESGERFNNERSHTQGQYTHLDVSKPRTGKMINEKIGDGDVPKCKLMNERASADCCKSSTPVRQMSAVELVRLPGVREGKSRIPKPLFQPYGSASRDSERFKVSESSSLIMTQSENYKRDAFVPRDQRHVTKPTMNYLNPELELHRLHKKFGHAVDVFKDVREYRVTSEEFQEELERNKSGLSDVWLDECSTTRHETTSKWRKEKEIKSKIDTGLKTRPMNITSKRKINSIMRQDSVPVWRIKKDIKSRIDTGLKNRPSHMTSNKAEKNVHSVPKMDKCRNRENANRDPAPMKRSNNSAVVRKEPNKRPVLPPLKNAPKTTKNGNDMTGSSSSCGDRAPLPGIQTASQHRNRAPRPGKQTASQKRNRAPLPGIQTASQNRNRAPLPRIQTASQHRNRAPLPGIQPTNQLRRKEPLSSIANLQKKDLHKASGKRSVTHRTLPPIKSSRANHPTHPLTNAETDNRATETVLRNQPPEVMWISFSPSPPRRKSADRGSRSNSARQDDGKRVSYERA